jgi:hypothetical protein
LEVNKIECGNCEHEVEEWPIEADDSIALEMYRFKLRKHGNVVRVGKKVYVEKALCGLCVLIFLAKPRPGNPEETFRQAIIRMRGGK